MSQALFPGWRPAGDTNHGELLRPMHQLPAQLAGELASAMVFDAGVYLTVVGATLLILAQLGILAQTSYDAPVEEGH